MKKLFTIFALLIAINVTGQNVLTADRNLEPLVVEFLNEGLERNIDLSQPLLEKLDTLIYDRRIGFPMFGYYNKPNKKIGIAPFVSIDRVMLRAVVFHEIAHIFLPEHFCFSCEDIMSEQPPETYHIYYDDEYWEKELDKIFDRIKISLEK